jgi:hypothetical protein
MKRPIASVLRWMVLANLAGGAALADGPAATQATTAPSGAKAPAPAPATRPARPLPELFRAELEGRRLQVRIVPREKLNVALTPDAVGVVAVADDADRATMASFEYNAAPSEEKWTVRAFPRDRGADGSFAHFAVSCDGRIDDHWSSLQLTSVENNAAALSITGGGRAGRGFVTVTLRQDARLGDVRFTVQRPRRIRPRPLHEFAAQDLLQLYSEHQQELRQYLLPLLKEAFGVNPLRPRAGDVYVAFATIPAEPAATEKIRALLPEIDSADPAQRDAASAKLNALGPSGVLAAARFDRSDLTPEQAARLDGFVARSRTWPDPQAAAQKDAYFLVDCLGDEDGRVRAAAAAALRALKGPQFAFDPTARPADRAKALDALYERLDDERDTPPADP